LWCQHIGSPRRDSTFKRFIDISSAARASTEVVRRDLGASDPAEEKKETMKSENAELQWDGQCAVCGKSVGHGEGFSHLNIEGQMIALCCPLCFETFEKDPAKYLRRRAVRKISEDTHPPGSFSPFDQ